LAEPCGGGGQPARATNDPAVALSHPEAGGRSPATIRARGDSRRRRNGEEHCAGPHRRDGDTYKLHVSVLEAPGPVCIWLQASRNTHGYSSDHALTWDEWDRLKAWVELQRAEANLPRPVDD